MGEAVVVGVPVAGRGVFVEVGVEVIVGVFAGKVVTTKLHTCKHSLLNKSLLNEYGNTNSTINDNGISHRR